VEVGLFDDGQTTVPAVTFAETDNKGAMDHIREVIATEGLGAAFFVGKDGFIRFKDRHSVFDPFSFWVFPIVAPTFTDGALGDDRYPFHDMQPSYDMDRVVNEVAVTVGSTTWTVTDADSIQRYYRRSLQLSPLFPSENIEPMDDFGHWELLQRKEPSLRFETLVLKPTTDAMWTHVLACEIGAPITVEVTYPNLAQSQDMIRNMIVERISHSIRPGDWTVTFGLRLDEHESFFQLDSSDLRENENDALELVGSEFQLGSSLLAY